MFTSYAASAGAGKTTSLVADYITLCLQSNFETYKRNRNLQTQSLHHFKNILAITFTNNAAAEMKGRIIRTLDQFAFAAPEDYDGGTKAIYGLVVARLSKNEAAAIPVADMQTFIQAESLELLRNIVHDYARFTLTTIDSFFQRVIRTSALRFNLSLNYSVQIDLKEFYMKAIEQTINGLTPENPSTAHTLFLLKNALEDQGKVKINNILQQTLNLLYDNTERNYEYIKKLRNILPEQLKEKITAMRKRRAEIPKLFATEIANHAQNGSAAMAPILECVNNYCARWFDKIQENPNDYLEKGASASVAKLASTDFVKKAFLNDEDVINATPTINKCYTAIAEIQSQYKKEYLDLKLTLKNIDNLLILFELQRQMEDIKQSNNIFLLTEANPMIYEMVKDDETPVIYDQLGFNHFFIDEFQDTSKMQWDNLKPLLKNRAVDEAGSITLFGDVKQAIYRFRNGDVSLFHSLSAYDTFRNSPYGFPTVDEKDYQSIPLSDNYRSKASIVRFNNLFFKEYAEVFDTEDAFSEIPAYYAGGVQNVKNPNSGLVQAFLYTQKNAHLSAITADEPDSSFARFIEEHKEELDIKEWEILRAVKDALDRGYRYGDIAILFSGNDKCIHTADLLLQCGFKVVTEKSLSLDASPVINLLIHTIRYLLHPNDVLSQVAILHFLAKIKGNLDLFKAIIPDINPAIESEKIDFDAAMQQFIGKRIPKEQWAVEPLLILVKEMVHFYGLEETNDPFLVDFNNFVLSYAQSRNCELSKFLLYWEQCIQWETMPSLTLPSGQDAIRVSTIHKSKGLEYPVVILTYSSKGSLNSVWTDVHSDDTLVTQIEPSKSTCVDSSYQALYEEENKQQLLDKINLMYVAHTRARDMLYLIAKVPENINDNTKMSSFLYTFIQRHLEEGKDGDAFTFTQNASDDRRYYAGDPEWRKMDVAKASDNGEMANPGITTSAFTLDYSAPRGTEEQSLTESQWRGISVHSYLSQLQTFPQSLDEVGAAVAEAPEALQESLRSIFERIVQDERLRVCFAPGTRVLNETTILNTDGNEYRPDRIVFLGDRIIVIDYKTGKENPNYQEQIDRYVTLLRQMGYDNVEGMLLYV